MACPAYGSTSEVSLWYATDATEANDDPLNDETIIWKSIPMTGESIDAALSSTISEEITTARSYSNSIVTSGEVTGSFNFEASPNEAFFDFLICALQNSAKLSVESTGTAWANAAHITNGSTKHCLALMKRVQKTTTTWDFYVFRGVQIGSMSLEMSPGSLMSGTCNLMGIRPDPVLEDAAKPAGWTLTPTTAAPLISAVGSDQTIQLQDNGGTPLTLTMQNVSLSFDNQLRQQQAIGQGHAFAAGIGSGRFMASLSASVYYQDAAIYDALLNDTELKFYAALRNSESDGINILLDKLKVTSGGLPMAGGPDQDLLISTEFRGFESASNGTAKITRITPP
jgi:hypothetical protein